MQSLTHLSRFGACIAIALAVGGAGLPLPMVAPGEWQVSATVGGKAERICLSDPGLLMQWEHRTKKCEQVILSSTADRAEVSYTCAGGGFGTSKVEVLTPRSIKVDSQGISDGYPYARTVFANRVGACPSR